MHNEVAAAFEISPEIIEQELRAGRTEILGKVSRWRVFALYAGRNALIWSLPEKSQQAIDHIIDSCNGSL